MKKFTSFICALMIAMSASAEVFNLTIEEKPNTYASTWGDPQFTIYISSEEGYQVTLYINGISEMENGKTYTYADMGEWSSVGSYNPYFFHGLSDAAITWSKDAEGLERYEGFVNDTVGNTYNFLYQEVPFAPTGDTIQVSFSKVGNFSYYDWSQHWTISGYDDSSTGNPYNVSFDLASANAESPVGHYTEADFSEDGSNLINISNGMSSKTRKFLEATIDIIERNDSLLLNAFALAEDGNVYDIFIYYADPKPLHQESISGKMTVDRSGLEWSSISFKGANADYEFSVSIYFSGEDYHGTYTYPNVYPSLKNTKNDAWINVFSGEITITAGEDGDILTAKLLCWNDTEYEINLTEGKPEKTREENIIITENVGLYTFEDPNKFIFWGCNEDSSRVVSISIFSDSIAGTYTVENLDLQNSYIGYDLNPMGWVTDKFNVLEANLTVSYDPETGNGTLTGTILAQSDYHFSDVPEFTIVLGAEPAHPHLDYDTEDADFEAVYNDYELTEAYEDGYVIVEAENETSTAALAFILGAGDTTFTAGTYTCSLKGEPMTVYTGSCDGQKVYVSFFATFNAQGYLNSLWFPYAGTATVDEEGVIVFDALNSYDRTIKVTLNPKKEQAIENVEEKAANLNKRLENGMIVIEKNGVKYNVIGNVIR